MILKDKLHIGIVIIILAIVLLSSTLIAYFIVHQTRDEFEDKLEIAFIYYHTDSDAISKLYRENKLPITNKFIWGF